VRVRAGSPAGNACLGRWVHDHCELTRAAADRRRGVQRAGCVARSTFYDWKAKGKLPRCFKLPNGDLRVRRSDLDEWLASLEMGVA
jgi:predicted DNA-binding transcriptional regulator AlpA